MSNNNSGTVGGCGILLIAGGALFLAGAYWPWIVIGLGVLFVIAEILD